MGFIVFYPLFAALCAIPVLGSYIMSILFL